EASEDGKLAIWSDRSGDSRFMLQNGVVTDLSEECNYGLDFAFGDAGYVECSSIDGDGDEERFSFKTTSKIVLDAEKKKMIEVDFTDEVSFIDSNHFAVQRDEDQIDIYVDGEKKKTIESEAKIGKVESDNENFYTLMKVKEITQSSGDEEEGFSWTSTTTADRVEGLTILDLNGEQIYDLGTDCSSRSSVNYLGEKLFTCTAAKDAESDKTTGIFNLDLNQPRVLFKDGKKLDIGDFNIMSSATKDRIIVADADLNSMIGDLMGAAFSSMMGASDESAGLNVLEKIKINSIGIIDTNGEYIVNPGDYNGLAIDFKRFVVDMQSITSNSIMPVDIDTSQISDELPLKRADGKGSDLVSIENGEVIKNIQGVFVLGNGYYGIEADDGIEYFLLDGTSFYKQQK
ncbi:hypothetical protein IJ847_03030, partial [Candidatus Saccharibacteria bacterium]|nr:hypothetical protein [Candidatus Saccharibacteria bacterium]